MYTQPNKAMKTPWDRQFLPGRSHLRASKSCHPQIHSKAAFPLHPDWLQHSWLSLPALDRVSPSPPTGPFLLLANGRDTQAAAPGQTRGLHGLHPIRRAGKGRCRGKSTRSGQTHTDASQLHSPSPQLAAAHKSLNL